MNAFTSTGRFGTSTHEKTSTFCPIQVSATEALSCLKDIDKETLAILDFDETLFLRNSTEAYLDSLRPQTFGAIFLQLLDKLKPWQFLPYAIKGSESRDWIRVVLATIFFPWTYVLWKRRVRSLVHTYENKALAQAISQNPKLRVIIATRGFNFIVKPMLLYLSIQPEQMIGCRFWQGGWDRQQGKEDLIAGYVDPQDVEAAILVTDSLDDSSLLQRVRYPLWVQWENAQYIPALANAYLPFFYLEHVKRPGTKFIYKVIVKNHLPCVLLAYTWGTTSPILHGLGMTFLVISFWCIYEIGYFENDRVAELYEANPVLSEAYPQYRAKMNVWQPWLFATVLGGVGVFLTYFGNHSETYSVSKLQAALSTFMPTAIAISWAAWMGVLMITRALYSSYNYVDEKTRIWIYPLLQMAKYLSFLVLTNITVVGFLLLASQIFVDWIPYVIYRCGGKRDQLEEQLLRLVIFLLFSVGLAIAMSSASWLMTGQFAVVVGWLAVRSRPQVTKLFKEAHFIWQ